VPILYATSGAWISDAIAAVENAVAAIVNVTKVSVRNVNASGLANDHAATTVATTPAAPAIHHNPRFLARTDSAIGSPLNYCARLVEGGSARTAF